LSLDGAGALFGLTDLFKRVYDYLQGVRETREVRKQLQAMLASLGGFSSLAKQARESGTLMVDKAMNLNPPITALEVENLMRQSIAFFGQFQTFLSTICAFGEECNDLVSGDFEGFMERVKTRKPDVHDIITFFGNNYDPNTGTLDLTRLPALLKIYGKEGGWKESKDISNVVADGKKKVDRLVEVFDKVRKQPRVHIRDRQLVVNYYSSFRRLGREGRRLHSNNRTLKQLKENAPSWYVDLMGISEQVRRALPGGQQFSSFAKTKQPRSGSWP
jgi:hypothetical protein